MGIIAILCWGFIGVVVVVVVVGCSLPSIGVCLGIERRGVSHRTLTDVCATNLPVWHRNQTSMQAAQRTE
jgi:hypothetical protein